MSTHSLRRTNPKGEMFVGRCVQCGAEGLPFEAARDECINPAGTTQEQALLDAILPPPPTKKEPENND